MLSEMPAKINQPREKEQERYKRKERKDHPTPELRRSEILRRKVPAYEKKGKVNEPDSESVNNK